MISRKRASGQPPRKPISDELVIQIALRRYSEGKILSLDELGHIFGREKTVISRCLKRAFSRHLVEVRPATVPNVKRLESLEREMLERFGQLRETVVIATDPAVGSDVVHSDLGLAAARWIPPAMLRDGDSIGIGSGRGVYHLIEALRALPKLRTAGIKLVSLSGLVLPGHEVPSRNSCLDADSNMAALGPVFEREIVYRPVSHPLAECDISRKVGHWEGVKLSHAWVGLGLFISEERINASQRRHRLFEIAEPGAALAPPDRVRELLKTLSRASEMRTMGGWSVVEVAHRCILVPPVVQRQGEPPSQLKKDVEELDRLLFNAPKELLGGCQSTLMIAGTKRKAHGLQYLLSDQTIPIHVLVTDDQCANAMLAHK